MIKNYWDKWDARERELLRSLLREIKQAKIPVTTDYFCKVLQPAFKIDRFVAEKVVALEVWPRLQTLVGDNMIELNGILPIFGSTDRWVVQLLSHGENYVKEWPWPITPFPKAIAHEMLQHQLQFYFLDLFESNNIRSQRSTSRKKIAKDDELLDETFDPQQIIDERERILASVVQRQGQSGFRSNLLEVYGYRCAISGCDAMEVLEAAHIFPYKGEKTNHISNRLILRSDLHTLFDLGLLMIDANTLSIYISSKLMNTVYSELMGKTLQEPLQKKHKINRIALQMRQRWFINDEKSR